MSGRTPTRSKGDSNRASSVKKSSSPGTLHKGKRPISQEGTPANHPSKLSPREDRAEKRAKSASAIKADTSTPVTGVLQASGSVSTKRALLQSQKRRPDGVASAVPKRLLANMGTPKQQQQQQTPNNSGLKPPTSSGRGSAPPTTVAEVSNAD